MSYLRPDLLPVSLPAEAKYGPRQEDGVPTTSSSKRRAASLQECKPAKISHWFQFFVAGAKFQTRLAKKSELPSSIIAPIRAQRLWHAGKGSSTELLSLSFQLTIREAGLYQERLIKSSKYWLLGCPALKGVYV